MKEEKQQGFFAKLWAGVKANTQVEELEADLYPADKKWNTPKGGEVEYERYGSGDRVLEVELKAGLEVAAGTTVEIWIEGLQVLDLIHTGEHQKFYLKTKDGQVVPEVKRGQSAEIRVAGETLVSGIFKRD